ncbi:MAG: protein kinase domain-containing protein [Chromatiales bacterium]
MAAHPCAAGTSDLIRGSLTEVELLQFAIALLDGLEQVHAAGVVHRDIKKAHILLRADGSPVLLDFGATRVALFRRRLTMDQRSGGDPLPGRLAGDSDPRTDIHALGGDAVPGRDGQGRTPTRECRGRACRFGGNAGCDPARTHGGEPGQAAKRTGVACCSRCPAQARPRLRRHQRQSRRSRACLMEQPRMWTPCG